MWRWCRVPAVVGGLVVGGMVATVAPAQAQDTRNGPWLLVVNKSESTLSFIDPATRQEVAEVPTGNAPHEVAVSPDGRWAYVTDYGTGPAPGNTVTVVDIPNRRVAATIDLGDHTRPHGVAVDDGGDVWVTTEGSAHLLVIDPETRRVAQETATDQQVTHMVALSPALDRAITASIGSGTASIVADQGNLLATLRAGAGAEGLDVTPDGRTAYVSNREAGTLSEIDLEGLRVTRTLEVGDFPIRVKVTPDGRRALVSNAQANAVAVVDLEEWRVERRIPVGAVPVGILITPDGRTAYVANTSADRISVLDLERWEVVGEVVAGNEPDGMAWVEEVR